MFSETNERTTNGNDSLANDDESTRANVALSDDAILYRYKCARNKEIASELGKDVVEYFDYCLFDDASSPPLLPPLEAANNLLETALRFAVHRALQNYAALRCTRHLDEVHPDRFIHPEDMWNMDASRRLFEAMAKEILERWNVSSGWERVVAGFALAILISRSRYFKKQFRYNLWNSWNMGMVAGENACFAFSDRFLDWTEFIDYVSKRYADDDDWKSATLATNDQGKDRYGIRDLIEGTPPASFAAAERLKDKREREEREERERLINDSKHIYVSLKVPIDESDDGDNDNDNDTDNDDGDTTNDVTNFNTAYTAALKTTTTALETATAALKALTTVMAATKK